MSFQDRLYREIPISKAMQVSISSLTPEHAELTAPLAPNINHEGTAFGGSVSSLALLASWSLVTSVLDTIEGPFDYVVVQDSAMDFVKPVTADFMSRATFGSPVERFTETLAKHGRARVEVVAEVRCHGVVCASMKARFVAKLTNHAPTL